jgi:hypothetical protein
MAELPPLSSEDQPESARASHAADSPASNVSGNQSPSDDLEQRAVELLAEMCEKFNPTFAKLLRAGVWKPGDSVGVTLALRVIAAALRSESERARVVEWLRNTDWTHPDLRERQAAADAIERGEHLERPTNYPTDMQEPQG